MKKILSIISSLVLILSLSNVAFASSDITVKLDGEILSFDVQPQLIGGRTMVPLRAIFEALGAVVEWDADSSTVTAYNEFYLVRATIGNNIMLVNGTEKQIDVPPMIVNSRTLVPARFIAEAFNCDVQWDSTTKTVYITSRYNDYSMVEQSSKPYNNNSINSYDNTPANSSQQKNNTEYYNGTHIPTYTSITGEELIEIVPVNGGMIYSYSDNENALAKYMDYIGNNGRDVEVLEGNDDSYCIIMFTGQKENQKTFMMTVEFAYEEVWVYIKE